MACYCGCRTAANKLKWLAIVLLVVFGLALIGGGIGKAVSCGSSYLDCMKAGLNNGSITPAQYDQYLLSNNDRNGQARGHLGDTPVDAINQCENKLDDCSMPSVPIMFYLGIAALILSTIPCCLMCCCTRNPRHTLHADAQVVYTKPVTTYNAGTYDNGATGATYPVGYPQQGNYSAAAAPQHTYSPYPTNA